MKTFTFAILLALAAIAASQADVSEERPGKIFMANFFYTIASRKNFQHFVNCQSMSKGLRKDALLSYRAIIMTVHQTYALSSSTVVAKELKIDS